jgi:hypothetical protein
MKKKFSAYFLLMLFELIISAGLKSQGTSGGYPVERVQVCTDRKMYISGENISISALVYIKNDIGGEFSRILYCELITPGGNRITGGKYPVEKSTAEGCLHIPEEAISGIYYLKSYTRFMRNGSQDNYNYIMLKIVNPYNTLVLAGNESGVAPGSMVTGLYNRQPGLQFKISTDKERYSARENIKIKVEGNAVQGPGLKLCLSVVPSLPGDSISAQRDSISNKRDSISRELQYYPETRGISISGRLLETQTGRPVPNRLVNLSIIGDKDIMAVRTNAAGRFYFALPGYAGNRDIFLCGEDIPENPAEIFIDNDFCPRPVSLPGPAFHLTEQEKEAAYHMAVNQKVTSVFLDDTLSGKHVQPPNNIPFYGKATDILVMDTYIDLPTIEDYFNELLGAVSIKKNKGHKVFRFVSGRIEMTIYDPLVLIDWVAVNDAEKILALSPKAIDRIELVDAPYVKGNITYGGIISFVSRKNDFAGIDLPASGTFVNYKFLEQCFQNISSGPVPENVPDSRNTVYWNPDVRTDDRGSAELLFTAPDTPGKYIAMLTEMGLQGEIIKVVKEFEVVSK